MKKQFISIGTGGVTGIYYPLGGAVCRLVNKGRKNHGVRCSQNSTGGSVYNIQTIRAGELEFGVAQSDRVYEAYRGIGRKTFQSSGAFKNLRALFSAHAEAVTIVARKDAGIYSVSDLKGKRLNVGNRGTGVRASWEVLEKSLGWQRSDLRLAAEMKSAEVPSALCANKIDAMIVVAGNPNSIVNEAVTTCDTVIVDTCPNCGPKCCKRNIPDYYAGAMIPGGMYRGNAKDIPTLGMRAIFVGSTSTSANTVYHVVRSVFSNFKSFRKSHPAFNQLNKRDMIGVGLTVPLHDGAIRYFKEAGLM